jgi:PST family polysaccharide transporter
MIAGYVVALPYGPKGVAFAYSAVLTLWVIPHIWLCVHGTMISVRDVLMAVSRPLASGILAGGLAFVVQMICGQFFSPLPRLVLESGVLLAAFLGLLLVAGQKSLYLDLLSELRGSSSRAEKISADFGPKPPIFPG